MKFKPGQSGNPRGRKPALASRSALHKALDSHLPQVLAKLIELALAGDVVALKTIIDKGLANARPSTHITLPEMVAAPTITDSARAVVAAVGHGLLSVEAGAQLLASIGSLARVQEVDELQRRIEALEAATGGMA